MNNRKEVWKPVVLPVKKHTVQYMISNHGRLAVKNPDGTLEVRKFKPTGGIYRYNIRLNGKSSSIFVTREVAKAFLKKPGPKHTFIIHKDHNYLNDHADNLTWATLHEHREHTTMSPRSVQARNRKAIVRSSHARVLNEKTVASLKKQIWDPERKLSYSQIAKRYGVSDMQIYRIKNGLFWYHVRVPNEPLHPSYKKNLQNIEFQQRKAEKQKAEKEKRRAVRESSLRRTEVKKTTAASEKIRSKKEIAAKRKKNSTSKNRKQDNSRKAKVSASLAMKRKSNARASLGR
jgi:hypothetical protein